MSEHSNFQRDMNEALDGQLSEAEWEALKANLEQEPEVSGYWERLRRVDRVLRSAVLVGPSAGFSGRVMAAIAAINLTQRRYGVGIVLGLMAAALITVPLFSLSLVVMFNTITNPTVLNTMLQAVASASSYLVDLAVDVSSGLRSLVKDTPMLPALVSTAIPLSMVWVWLVWYLSGGSTSINREVI